MSQFTIVTRPTIPAQRPIANANVQPRLAKRELRWEGLAGRLGERGPGSHVRPVWSTGDVFEVAWTSFNEQQNPDASGLSHRAALEGIRRADADPTVDDLAWVLVTWVSANGTAP